MFLPDFVECHLTRIAHTEGRYPFAVASRGLLRPPDSYRRKKLPIITANRLASPCEQQTGSLAVRFRFY